MEAILNPVVMIAAFVAFVGFVVLHEIGRLMGARQASKTWTAATGISLEELEAGTFKSQLSHLREAITRAREAH